MSDYDIVIQLDPASPVAGAKKVTGAVAEIETQSESANKALKEMAAGVKATADEVGKLRENTSGLNDGIGKMLKEAAKGFGMQALHQGLMDVGQGLQDATKGAFNMSNAMLGFSVGGPVGAAIGGFSDALKQTSTIFDDTRQKLEEHSRAARELVEQHFAAARAEEQLWHAADDALRDVNAALFDQRKVLADVNLQLKVQNDLRAAGKALGGFGRGDYATLSGKLAGAGEDAVYDSRGGIGNALTPGNPVQSLAQQAAASFQNSFEAATTATDELFDRWTKRAQEASADAFDKNVLGSIPANYIPETKFGLGDQTSALGASMGLDSPGAIASTTSSLDEMHDAMEANQKAADALLAHFKPLEDFFVEFATTGKASIHDLVNSVIADFARMGSEALVKDLVSLFKSSPTGGIGDAVSLLGGGSHAFGGSTIAPSTGGGVDSILMLSRVSPGERIDYTPPGHSQAQQGRGSSAPAPIVQIVDQRDSRALMQGPDFERAVHQVLLKNPGLVKRLAR